MMINNCFRRESFSAPHQKVARFASLGVNQSCADGCAKVAESCAQLLSLENQRFTPSAQLMQPTQQEL